MTGALLVVVLGACQSSESSAKPKATTTTMAPAPGFALVNAKTCKRVAPDVFRRVSDAAIVSTSTQSAAGALQEVRYVQGSCTFELSDSTIVTLGILVNPTTSALFTAHDFTRLTEAAQSFHPNVSGSSPSISGIGDKAFIFKGPVDDTIFVLEGNHIFTVNVTHNRRAVPEQVASRFGAAILKAVTDKNSGK